MRVERRSERRSLGEISMAVGNGNWKCRSNYHQIFWSYNVGLLQYDRKFRHLGGERERGIIRDILREGGKGVI